jgi:YD repeat-containing protein
MTPQEIVRQPRCLVPLTSFHVAIFAFATGAVLITGAFLTWGITTPSRGLRTALVAVFLVILFWAMPVLAQIQALDAPVFSEIDDNGVDLFSGNVFWKVQDLAIGASGGRLSHTYTVGSASPDLFTYYVTSAYNVYAPGTSQPVTAVRVAFEGSSELFYLNNSQWLSLNQRGSTLVKNSDSSYTYTRRDGSVATLNSPSCGATTIAYPDGRVLTQTDKGVNLPAGVASAAGLYCRVQSVTRSDGLQIKYSYAFNGTPANNQQYLQWAMPTSYTAINNAFAYCDPTADTCSLTGTWPTATYSSTSTTLTITDSASRVTRFTLTAQGQIASIRLPTSASIDNLTFTYCGNACYVSDGTTTTYFPGMVDQLVRDGQTWKYVLTPALSEYSWAYYTVTNPAGGQYGVQMPGTYEPQTSFVSPFQSYTDLRGVQFFGLPTSYTGQVNEVSKPEGNYTIYTYDGRGNLTQEQETPKSGSNLPVRTRTANYDATCSNPVTCNEPHWVKDWQGNETDYTFDPTHGGLLIATSPPDANGVRPQATYTYTQRYAWVLNSSGAYVKSVAPFWLLATETICRTSSATSTGCSVAGDQVVTTYEYGPDSGPNNLFVRGVSVAADGATHRTCYGYDPYGNRISETTPNAGLTSCP